MTTLEKIKLQKEYKGKRASVQGASTIAKVRLLREAKEILAQLKGTSINPGPAVFTIQQVSAAMSQTGMGTLWYDDPSINNPINYGVQQGWLYRPSTTQVEWTEAGVALSKAAAIDPQPPEKQPATLSDVNAVLPMLKNFIGKSQLAAMGSNVRGEEGQFFKDKFVEVADTITKMPSTYQTDEQGDDAIAYLHYFKGGSDWYVTEKDKGDPDDPIQGVQSQAFGYTILNGDKEMAETGYISIEEIIKVGAELDLYWQPKSLKAIKGEDKQIENKTAPGEMDLRAMKNAVVDHGGEVTGEWTGRIDFTLHAGSGGPARLAFSPGEGYRVVYGAGFNALTQYYPAPYDAVEEFFKAVAQNRKLTNLLSGKHDDLQPEAYMTIVQDVISEIKDVEPVKPAVLAYIQKAKDKGLITESAAMAAFEAILNGK